MLFRRSVLGVRSAGVQNPRIQAPKRSLKPRAVSLRKKDGKPGAQEETREDPEARRRHPRGPTRSHKPGAVGIRKIDGKQGAQEDPRGCSEARRRQPGGCARIHKPGAVGIRKIDGKQGAQEDPRGCPEARGGQPRGLATRIQTQERSSQLPSGPGGWSRVPSWRLPDPGC